MKVEIDSDSSVDIIKVLDLISDSDTLRTGTLGKTYIVHVQEDLFYFFKRKEGARGGKQCYLVR